MNRLQYNKKHPANFLFILLILFLVVTGCNRAEKKADTESLIPVEVISAEQTNLTENIDLTASIVPYAKVEIVAKVAGRVLKIHVRDGEKVQAGQLLVELEHNDAVDQVNQAEAAVKTAKAALNLLLAGARDQERVQAQAALQSAEADMSEAKRNAERMNKLFSQGAVSRADLDAAELALTVKTNLYKTSNEQLSIIKEGARPQEIDMARARLAQAEASLGLTQTMLKETYLKASIDGEISSRNVDTGDFVTPGLPLMSVNSINPCWAEAYASPDIFARIRLNMKAVVTVDALPGSTFVGKVQEMDPYTGEETRNYKIRVLLDNPQGTLTPGMFAKVSISAAEYKNAIVVPIDAIIERNGDSFAFVINGGVAEERKIQPGMNTDGKIQVKSGIKPGDKIVTTGASTLFNGAKVRVITRASEK
ncbi:MAG: efflux RND transporter periplasmic adaptor subunit [Chloroflexi bacterium]|nr:efflux RND transporter periplasmic adaptor subunit [Chloroflexota bacterium]